MIEGFFFLSPPQRSRIKGGEKRENASLRGYYALAKSTPTPSRQKIKRKKVHFPRMCAFVCFGGDCVYVLKCRFLLPSFLPPPPIIIRASVRPGPMKESVPPTPPPTPYLLAPVAESGICQFKYQYVGQLLPLSRIIFLSIFETICCNCLVHSSIEITLCRRVSSFSLSLSLSLSLFYPCTRQQGEKS